MLRQGLRNAVKLLEAVRGLLFWQVVGVALVVAMLGLLLG